MSWSYMRVASVLVLLAGASAVDGQSPQSESAPAEQARPGPPFSASIAKYRARARHAASERGLSGTMQEANRLLAAARDAYMQRRSAPLPRAPLQEKDVEWGYWKSIGPSNGAGRVSSVAALSGKAIFVGTADGGVWKSVGGGSWTSLTDDIPYLSVGAVAAVTPPPPPGGGYSPPILYVGTGEGIIGGIVPTAPGIGLLRSSNGGQTWEFPTSVLATRFFRLSVNPLMPDEVFAATDGGGFLSLNGGASWTQTIPKATYGWVADVVRHPTNPAILYATTWSVDPSQPGYYCGTCLSSRVLKSIDGGMSWQEKSQGLPIGSAWLPLSLPMRMSLAIAPSSPETLYLAVKVGQLAHVYKTTTGGDQWTDLPGVYNNHFVNTYFGSQSDYNNAIVVSPTDAEAVIAGGVNYITTSNGGATWSPLSAQPTPGSKSLHVDAHALRAVGSLLVIGNDGGVWTSTDFGATVTESNANLITRQYYSVAQHPTHPDIVVAGAQDNGTNLRSDASLAWSSIGGGDGGGAAFIPSVPSYVLFSWQYGKILRRFLSPWTPYNEDVSPPIPLFEEKPFETLVVQHPNAVGRVYTGSYRVWSSLDSGDHWTALPTATNDGSEWSSQTPISALAVAPSAPEVMVVAKAVGVLNQTLDAVFWSIDGGMSWVKAMQGLPARRINHLEIHPGDTSTAYAALGRAQGDGPTANVYRTTNGGLSWVDISGNLPVSSAYVVRMDPTGSSTLYVGTDVGVYRSTDGGDSWWHFGIGLPAAMVQDIQISPDAQRMRVATFGRGVWELGLPVSPEPPPAVSLIQFPGGGQYPLGSTLTFQSAVEGAVSSTWVFTDDWQPISQANGSLSIEHTFSRPGPHAVSLVAVDDTNQSAHQEATFFVQDPANHCETPTVIPPFGQTGFARDFHPAALTAQASDPVVQCAAGATTQSGWLEFDVPETGIYTFSTCGSNADTTLSLWTGEACGPYTLIAAACNDNAPAGSGCEPATASLLSATLSAGQKVRVLVTGVSSIGQKSPFTLSVSGPP